MSDAATIQDHPDPKYRVTMRSISLGKDGETLEHKVTDYVPTSMLEAYVANAQGRWQNVVVSDEPDFGPGGVDGPTADLSNEGA